MFAIVKAGGRQEKVAAGDVITVDRLDVEPGAEITFDQVLLVSDKDGAVTTGSPYVNGASVSAVVEAQTANEQRLPF